MCEVRKKTRKSRRRRIPLTSDARSGGNVSQINQHSEYLDRKTQGKSQCAARGGKNKLAKVTTKRALREVAKLQKKKRKEKPQKEKRKTLHNRSECVCGEEFFPTAIAGGGGGKP